jgi:hypothetical protein
MTMGSSRTGKICQYLTMGSYEPAKINIMTMGSFEPAKIKQTKII